VKSINSEDVHSIYPEASGDAARAYVCLRCTRQTGRRSSSPTRAKRRSPMRRTHELETVSVH